MGRQVVAKWCTAGEHGEKDLLERERTVHSADVSSHMRQLGAVERKKWRPSLRRQL